MNRKDLRVGHVEKSIEEGEGNNVPMQNETDARVFGLF